MYNLKKIRNENGITQQALCEALKNYGYHIDRTTYTKYETGASRLPCDVLIALAKYYNKSTDEILGIK